MRLWVGSCVSHSRQINDRRDDLPNDKFSAKEESYRCDGVLAFYGGTCATVGRALLWDVRYCGTSTAVGRASYGRTEGIHQPFL